MNVDKLAFDKSN